MVFFNSSSDPIIDSIKKFTTVNDTYKATDKSIVANTITVVDLCKKCNKPMPAVTRIP